MTNPDSDEQVADEKSQPRVGEQRPLDVRDDRPAEHLQLAYQSMFEVLLRLDRRIGGERRALVETGFRTLDHLLCGLKPGQLIILAGRPSTGKTALALNIAEHVALDQRIATVFVSLERSALEVGERLLTSAARVSVHRMQTGRIGSEERSALADAAVRFHDAPLHLDDSTHVRVSDIAANVRRLGERSGGGQVGLVVIDYLQLIESDNPQTARQEQVASTVQHLKQLAKDAHCPVLCLCQLGRPAEGSSDQRLGLDDLSESGSIEQDADVVLFVHRYEHYLSGQEEEQMQAKAEIIVAKHRNGPTGIAELSWREEFTRFEEAART